MDDELEKKLRAWTVEPEVPPAFQREVWERIARQTKGENTRDLWGFDLWVWSQRPHPGTREMEP